MAETAPARKPAYTAPAIASANKLQRNAAELGSMLTPFGPKLTPELHVSRSHETQAKDPAGAVEFSHLPLWRRAHRRLNAANTER